MKVRFLFFLLLSLTVILAGCADSSSNGTSNSASNGIISGNVGNIKEYFTAGPQSTTATASLSVNAKTLYKANQQYNNDFENKNDIDGVRLYFRYADNTTAEAVYNIGGQNYNAIVDDMVYAGHNWIGLELEQLYSVNGTPNQANRRTDRIGLVNIKTGEIIVVENTVFQKCQDLETLEVLAGNKAYFLCENGAYSLDLQSKDIVQIGSSKNDKFDDSTTIIFADGTGVYQSTENRNADIKFIDNDTLVQSDLNTLPAKTFKNSNDDVFFFGSDNKVYQLKLNNGRLVQEEVTLSDGSEVIAGTAVGPVRNEDDATAKFMNKQVIIDGTDFYVYDVIANTVTKTTWNNTDYDIMKKFINQNDDLEEHIFFGENGIAYVANNEIKYISYTANAEPKTVTLPNSINGYEIDDITLIGNMLYFQLEESRTERETYYKADVSQDNINAEEYVGSKTIMKVINLDVTVSSDNNDNNAGTDTGADTGTDNATDNGTGTETGTENTETPAN